MKDGQELEEGIEEVVLDDGGHDGQDSVHEDDEDRLSPDDERAMRDGWKPRDEWDGNPDDWVSAKKFNERGEMMGTIRELKGRLDRSEKDFESRIENLNSLHDAQQKALISDLEIKRDAAIDMADRDEAKRIQGQIDNLNTAKPVVSQQAPAQNALNDWNANNPWIFENSPKAAYAQQRFAVHSQSMGVEEAIRSMESEIKQHFPDVNPNRDRAPAVERGKSRPGRQSRPQKIAWSDLSGDEIKYFNAMPGAWKSKEEYLQAVADSRGNR